MKTATYRVTMMVGMVRNVLAVQATTPSNAVEAAVAAARKECPNVQIVVLHHAKQ